MDLKYFKLESSGNNFILLDFINTEINQFDKISNFIFKEKAVKSSDGLLVINNSQSCDFDLNFYNPDSSPSFCGNGSVCAVKYMTRIDLKKEYNFLSNGLHCKAQVNKSDIAIKIPKINKYREFINGFLINTGTLHYVEFSKSLHDNFFNKKVLELTSSQEFLKAPFNINIVKKENDHIQIRTFEKGVNRETLSCGSGSTASILAVFLAFKKKYSLVKARGGNLNVDFHFNNKFFEKIRLISKPTIINSGNLSIEV